MKLSKSPLQEVIFELFLEEQLDSNGMPSNDDYQFAQGLFFNKIKDQFPIYISKQKQSPITVYPSISHQFWKDKNVWPVVQFGPGLMTVNDTEVNYEWDQFLPLVNNCIQFLLESYNHSAKIKRLSLKYIDAIEFETNDVSKQLDFINKNFQLNLTNNFEIPDSKLTNINIQQSFNISNLGNINFAISSGFSKKNLPSIIWQYQAMIDWSNEDLSIENWIIQAHSVLSNLFKQTITKEFYDSFK